ncbi:membrane-bound O-acyltransferase family MBOAT protein (macronuclear) [Tetrahymena thermophila SB210]|uniref:Membrane-bound O-acyltransferase family MBOAT protein n=1 Tax=Tetrahymena thermophila (strain SB210) TaxID=312017 RepID=I7LZR7_TETTS|nr:membrane-bound O-acyltransferase family MBOAT protein [Tetrahymena thermophila SB210]EAR84788.1 membrane-bound O-acyltransferase family MBOAT protein [Tetrahymena thermophila SB210]|eukprot:XP_001032451.1 membrane-bound O-acyltransferase family MBOAT protein [Tetrahymena thermophila SB210]
MVFAALDLVFEQFSKVLNIPADQIRLVSALIMAIPFGIVFSFLRGSFIRHFLSIVLGLFLQYLVYKDQIVFVLLQTLAVYLMLKIFNRKSVAIVVFVQSLIYMSAHHIYRQWASYGSWDMDITTILMMTICKWTGFAWCYQDGGKDESKLSVDQKMRQLKKLPSFLEYFSYIHFFGSAICGPNFDYYEFNLFIHKKEHYSKIPFTLFNSLEWLLKAAAFSGIYICLLPRFPLSYVLSQEYADLTFLEKSLFFNICITLIRIKYYAGWCFSQAGVASSGLSYNGKCKDGKNKWDRVLSCIPSNELSYDIKYKVECWNSSVQFWLKKYVYLRIYPENGKKSVQRANIAQYATNIISAFWHGFYPGYYTAFFQWSLCMTCAKLFYNASINKAHVFNKIRKSVSSPVFNVGRFLLAQVPLNCFGIGFQLLSLENNHTFFKTHSYVYLILVVLVILAFNVTGWGQKSHKKKTEGQPEQETPSGENAKSQ